MTNSTENQNEFSTNILQFKALLLKLNMNEIHDNVYEFVSTIYNTRQEQQRFWLDQLKIQVNLERKNLRIITLILTFLNLDEETLDQIVKMNKQKQVETYGHIYSFGKNDYQLGYGCDRGLQPVAKRVDAPESFVCVAASKIHSLGLTNSGDVYAWGQGKSGRLGLGDEKVYLLPTCLKLKFKVVKIATGRDHSIMLAANGVIFAFGCNRYGQLGIGNTQKQVVNFPEKVYIGSKLDVCDISASTSHSMAVTTNGSVYCWGRNDSQQLGFRSSGVVGQTKPCLLPDKTLPKIISCSCADGKSLALSADGKVFQWGNGNPKAVKLAFHRDQTPSEERWNTIADKRVTITAISASKNHCAAISDIGEVFTWGSAAELLGYTTIGNARSVRSHTTTGRRVEKLFSLSRVVVSISCSKRHTVAVDRLGCAWVWGHGDHGVLGLELATTYIPEPHRIPNIGAVSGCSTSESQTVLLQSEVIPEQRRLRNGLRPLVELTQNICCPKVSLLSSIGYLAYSTEFYLKILEERCTDVIVQNLPALLWQANSTVLKVLCSVYQIQLPVLKPSLEIARSPFVGASPIFAEILPSTVLETVKVKDEVSELSTVEKCLPKAKILGDNRRKSTTPTLNPELFCRLCGIQVPDNQAMVEHVAGKRHRSASDKKNRTTATLSQPVIPSPLVQPQVMQMLTSETKRHLTLTPDNFPKMSLTPLVLEKKLITPRSQTHISSKRVKSLRLLSSTSQNSTRPAAITPNPWNKKTQKSSDSAHQLEPNVEPSPASGLNLMSIMQEEQLAHSSTIGSRVSLSQSAWGRTVEGREDLSAIQQQQVEQMQLEKDIEEQRQLLEYYAALKDKEQEKSKAKKKSRRRYVKKEATEKNSNRG